MKALDLFCGAGGATRGLQLAGFHVTGVDLNPQPRYIGDAFHQADALTYPLDGYDLIWASPPCQAHSILKTFPNARPHADLIPQTRARLKASGVPYIIENVASAPLHNALLLCGTMFGLLVVRHRLFETSTPIYFPPSPCAHARKVVAPGRRPDRTRNYAAVHGNFSDLPFARLAMGIDWMTQQELAQAIPTAYSEYVTRQLMEV